MKRKLTTGIIRFLTMLVVIVTCNNALAIDAPVLTVSTSGLDVSLSWTSVSGASGHTLYYAPYPYTAPNAIGSVDMGISTTFSITLWDGASYYVAITSSDGTNESEYSNIVLFAINSDIQSPQPDNTISNIPDTGQDFCYSDNYSFVNCSGTGQDGEYITKQMSLIDNGDGTVKDSITGLVWQQRDDGVTRNLIDAEDYCSNLFLGNFEDWRIPNLLELVSIVDYGERSPAINSLYFPDTKASYYWGNKETNNASSVNFLHGGGSYNWNIEERFYVRCVQ